jgi:site-specific DNA recombinase
MSNRAVIYTRVSSLVQETDGYSLESQTVSCFAFAKEHGLTVLKHAEEVDSGGYFHDRKVLNEVREEIRRGMYDVFVFFDLDRLTRDIEHISVFADECDRNEVKLLCVKEDFDRSPEGILIRTIRTYAAMRERGLIGERSLRGRKQKALEGKLVCGHSPYGYRYNKETGFRDIVEYEADIVRQIFGWYLDGQSTYEIQNHLNASGVLPPSRRPGHWHCTGVVRILRNEIYYGATHGFKFKKTTTVVRGIRHVSARRRDPSEWIELPSEITPAIITKPVFDAVQLLLDRNGAHRRRGKRGEYLLRQRVICGVCGRKMRGEKDSRSPWKAYRCVAHIPELKCGNSTLRAQDVEPVVWDKITEIIEQPKAIHHIISSFEQRRTSKDALHQILKSRRTDAMKCERALDALTERIGDVSPALWERLKVQLEAKQEELTRLKELVKDTENQIRQYEMSAVDFKHLESYIKTVRSKMRDMPFEERETVIRALDVKATWTHGKLYVSMSVIPSYYRDKLELVSDDSKRIELA